MLGRYLNCSISCKLAISQRFKAVSKQDVEFPEYYKTGKLRGEKYWKVITIKFAVKLNYLLKGDSDNVHAVLQPTALLKRLFSYLERNMILSFNT